MSISPLRRIAALALAGTLLCGILPAAQAAPTPGAVRVADADTRNDFTISLGDDDSTLLDGRVWTDKSVSTGNIQFDGDAGTITVENDSDFLVTYSALATSTQIISESTAPVDVVFVLDFSASMAWGQYQNGQGTVTTQAESRVQAMVDGINNAIDALVQANENNRIGIVVFNRGASTMLNLNSVSARPDKDYLAITYWNATPGQDDGNNNNVRVTCNIDQVTLPLDSYTNIHAGIYFGMQMLLNATDTQVEVENQMVTRVPNLILMSDGAPTTFSRAITGGEWWAGIENTPIGSGDNNTPHSGNGFLPLVTAAYMKNAVTAHYYPNAQPGESARVFTIGFMTSQQNQAMVNMADLVLEPGRHWDAGNNYTATGTPAVDAVNTAWQQYLAGTAPQVQYTQSGREESYTADVAPEPYNPTTLVYPDAYFAADDADALWNAFSRIVNNITSSAQGPTRVENNDPVHSGYIYYRDPIGQYMQVNSVKTILWAGIQFDLDNGYTPTPQPQPGGGVRYVYTGHFSDANGNKNFDSQVYGRGNVNDILVYVDEDAAGDQTLHVAVPASAIPIRVNSVTLNPEDLPVDNVSNGAFPLRVCYTVGLKPGVTDPNGTLNTNPDTGGVTPDYLAAHTDPATNQVYFYANRYSGNAEDGITVGNATVEFEPASTNPFYFLQENTPLYTDSACTIRANDASFDPDRYYYFKDDYYAGAGETVQSETYVIRRMGITLQDNVARDAGGWYIRADAPRLGNLTDLIRTKGQGNLTQTAQASFYPIYTTGSQPGGVLNAFQGNNGRLALAAPAALSIAKIVTADAGLDIPAGTSFGFTLTVASKAGQTITATRSTQGSTSTEPLAFDGGGNADFTLQPGDILTIPDMQNTSFTVQESTAPDGFVLDSVSTVPAGIGSFDAANRSFAGSVAADPAMITFTNAYRAQFAADAQVLRIPVYKTLSGYRDTWLPGESYTFHIAPASRADNNLNAAIPITATELTLSQGVPAGNFVLNFSRLLDAAVLDALRSRAAEYPAAPEPVSTPESSPADPGHATQETALATPETSDSTPMPTLPSTPETSTPSGPAAEAVRRAPQPARATLAGLTAEQAARLAPDTARALLDSIPGTYYYTITEMGDAASLADQGVTKDLSRYEAAITVTDDGKGVLTAALTSLTRVADADGTVLPSPETATGAEFENRTSEPPASATPQPGTPASQTQPADSRQPAQTPAASALAVPQTGDRYPLAGLLAAAVVSASLLGVLLYRRNRQ
ncbi:FctA domain-containing protein [uncultured Gemmiger sp.]|uniref:Spy0128 family protein n=1 Tax=uncultured Gemmiger sp. TaxID=1623490 RepID=UPI0025D155FA|nr:FctA domain-containing protein [uncultured Gemmiger sp.]